MLNLDNLPEPLLLSEKGKDKEQDPAEHRIQILKNQRAFGYTYEDLRMIISPMSKNGEEPIGSMGNDTPLAILSDRPMLLFDYFKELFAQVTNPPIDANREEIVTATEVMIGSEQNLLESRPENCRQIKLQTPILTNEELEKLRCLNRLYFRTITLPILF